MNTKFYTLVALLATTLAGFMPAKSQTLGPVTDTIYMGAGPDYSNEVYYSMSSGEKGKVNRSLWDIAFRADRMSASIITNDASGVELYTIPKGPISSWANTDTTGIYAVKNMVNSPSDWEDGAFCRNQKGHPDYGWGIYNSANHNVVGDSLFMIKLRDGSVRKIWIVKKYSSNNIFEFRYANLDGSHDTTISLDCNPFINKNFIGFSISTNKVVDFEPAPSANWDILFTKYMGLAGTTPYPYTGVLINYGVKASMFRPVPLSFIEYTKAPMFTTRSLIGASWKKYNFATNKYAMTDSLVYFVQDRGGNINKLVFKEFLVETGRIVLQKEVISFTGINEIEKSGFSAAVYPNPVRENMNLVVNPGKSGNAVVTLLDISGRVVINRRFDVQAEDLNTLQIPVSGLPSGIYMLKIQAGTQVVSRKVVVNN